MGMQSGGQKGGPLADLNVVPLIDILLVLIIIFMVITPLMPKGLEALLPQTVKGEAPPLNPVVVQVGAGGAVKINLENASWETIEARLAEIFKGRAEKVAFVRGDTSVQFSDVARAISLMRGAGIEKVGLLTAGMEAGQ